MESVGINETLSLSRAPSYRFDALLDARVQMGGKIGFFMGRCLRAPCKYADTMLKAFGSVGVDTCVAPNSLQVKMRRLRLWYI